MNGNAIIMKKEIRAISNYRALIISKHYMTLILAIASLYLGFIRYAMSSLYILIILQALPLILTYAVKEYLSSHNNKLLNTITQNRPFQLSNLKRKYRYTLMSYVTNSISFFISLLLICLWQYNYTVQPTINTFLKILPVLILTTSFLLRFFGIIFYQIKLPYDLSHNKV